MLLIFNSHLDKHVTKLQLQQPLRLVLAVVARRVRLLRPQWPTGFEFRMALDQMWNLRSFSLGRLVDCILQCPQVDASFRQVVKSLFDSIRKDMTGYEQIKYLGLQKVKNFWSTSSVLLFLVVNSKSRCFGRYLQKPVVNFTPSTVTLNFLSLLDPLH